MKISYTVKDIDFSGIDESAIVNDIASKVDKAFLQFGPHMTNVAQNRAPVGEAAREGSDYKPRAFQLLDLKPLGTFGPPASSAAATRLAELHGFTSTKSGRKVGLPGLVERVSAKDIKFFQGRAGANKGKTPDALSVGKTVKGAFQHQPGTLRKSIKFDGIRHEGNQVKAIVRAHAPYAKPVHNGFTHRGGRKHGGQGTYIKGRPFLVWALTNIRGRLKDPANYE